MNYQDTLHKIEITEIELSNVAEMTEAEACKTYNVDFKREIIQIINEDLEILKREADRLIPLRLIG